MFAYKTRMKISRRIPSTERREQIIEAAKRVFARNGFHGTTTKLLAQEAQVSEALLFKHFPSKEAMYKAMLEACRLSESGAEFDRVLSLEPSTSTLAILIHFLFNKVVRPDEDVRTMSRMIARSLSENGDFARVILDHLDETWIAKFRECLAAAKKAGDLRPQSQPIFNSAWFAHHVIVTIALYHIPEPCVVDYKMSREKLAEECVKFCLRGMGFKDEAIERHYNPRALALFSAAQA